MIEYEQIPLYLELDDTPPQEWLEEMEFYYRQSKQPSGNNPEDPRVIVIDI